MQTSTLFHVLALFPIALQAENAPAPQFLLPGTAQPTRYALELTIVPSETSFHGVAAIDLELKECKTFSNGCVLVTYRVKH